MGRLDGKVALISGGARGQGAVETELFSNEGAKVVFGDIRDDEGKQVEAKIRELGGDVTYIHMDATNEEDWQKAVALAESQYGKLDILVNNAGISIQGGLEDFSEADWDRTLAVNSKGVFLGTKHAIPEMRRAGGGSIVNISSGAGIAPSPGTSAAYAASKGAVRIFTKATAVQYAGENIRCNSVHPGPVDTPMIRTSRADEGRAQEQVARIPLGRIGTPEDMAGVVAFLGSEDARHVTGVTIDVNGGYFLA